MRPSPSTNLPPDAGPTLLTLARHAVADELNLPSPAPDLGPAWLRAPGACFVTLEIDGRLRGCIGSLRPHRALAEDVTHNACSAAFHDRRFDRLTSAEYPRVDFEVSVLSTPETLTCADRADLAGQLRPGLDGLLVTYPGHRGTFLPQVWEMVDGVEEFLTRLWAKARLPAGFWHRDLSLSRYTVTPFREVP